MIDTAVLSHQNDALNETCVVSVTSANPTTGLSGYGMGARTETATAFTLRCLYIPSRRSYDREMGMMVTIPARLLVEGPLVLVSAAVTITFREERYRVGQVTTDGPGGTLVLVTLEAI